MYQEEANPVEDIIKQRQEHFLAKKKYAHKNTKIKHLELLIQIETKCMQPKKKLYEGYHLKKLYIAFYLKNLYIA